MMVQVYNNRITDCGVHDYVLNGGSKNGEGIYLGKCCSISSLKGDQAQKNDVKAIGVIVKLLRPSLMLHITTGGVPR